MMVLSCPSWAVDRTSVLNCCWTEPVPFGQIAVPLLTRLHLRSKRWMSLRSRLRLSQQNMAEPLVGWRALPPSPERTHSTAHFTSFSAMKPWMPMHGSMISTLPPTPLTQQIFARQTIRNTISVEPLVAQSGYQNSTTDVIRHFSFSRGNNTFRNLAGIRKARYRLTRSATEILALILRDPRALSILAPGSRFWKARSLTPPLQGLAPVTHCAE